jgi:hypothetical protein
MTIESYEVFEFAKAESVTWRCTHCNTTVRILLSHKMVLEGIQTDACPCCHYPLPNLREVLVQLKAVHEMITKSGLQIELRTPAVPAIRMEKKSA